MVKYVADWDNSYKNKDNYVFYPQEDIVRFISKYIRKRVGVDEFVNQADFSYVPKVLDFGCGIGRHIKLLDEFKLEGYGFDLSKEAINVAKSNFRRLGLEKLVDRVTVSGITNLPYQDKSFDFMLSHGVLDSMPFETARTGMMELYRCLNDGGKVYFDLISNQDDSFETNGFERIIRTEHEKNTVQSYFNDEKIHKLISGLFKILEVRLNINKDLKNNTQLVRYHIVVEKNK